MILPKRKRKKEKEEPEIKIRDIFNQPSISRIAVGKSELKGALSALIPDWLMTYTRRVVNCTFLQDTRAERPPNRGQSIIAES